MIIYLGKTVTLKAELPAGSNVYAVGSRYAWGPWPIATLFASFNNDQGLPVLPWSQALTLEAPF